jgi:hypothetical protein
MSLGERMRGALFGVVSTSSSRKATTLTSRRSRFGETGVVDMLGVIGYFTAVSMVLDVAQTPPPEDASVRPLERFPL